MAAGYMAVTLSQEAEGDDFSCSAGFLLFIQPKAPAHEMVLPTVQVGSPTSVNPI